MTPTNLKRRQHLLAAAALGGLAAAPAPAAVVGAPEAPVQAQEFWARKGGVKLWVYRKYIGAGAVGGAGAERKPLLFLVHGSPYSSKTMFDLQVAGRKGYSMMDHFARLGFDAWTMDHEGHGHSDRTPSYSDIASGVDDLKVAMGVVMRHTWQTNAAFYASVFTRDEPGAAEPMMGQVVADEELRYGDTVPNGTYLDMVQNLPVCEPEKIRCPVLIIRAEHDGIATDEDVMGCFAKLPLADKPMPTNRW